MNWLSQFIFEEEQENEWQGFSRAIDAKMK
jgi:hypothetical protein